jgi:hypothetical protein
MKVPAFVEDSFIPMEVEDIISLQEQRRKRDQYWKMLYEARQEFLRITGLAAEYEEWASRGLYHYVEHMYGLRVELIDGKITGEYAVIDEKKYLLFLLKFGS